MNTEMVILQTQGQGSGMGFIWIILIFVVMWFLMLGPQRKKEKEERKFREGLKKGDRVIFSGGIYGKIHSVGEHTVEVEVAGETVLTVEKSMVQPVVERKEEKKSK